ARPTSSRQRRAKKRAGQGPRALHLYSSLALRARCQAYAKERRSEGRVGRGELKEGLRLASASRRSPLSSGGHRKSSRYRRSEIAPGVRVAESSSLLRFFA